MATPVPQKDDVENWTVEQVAAWLQQVELSECCDIFLRKGIDGHQFLQLTEEDLFLWGRDVSIRNRKNILKLVSQIKNLQQHPSATRLSIDDDDDFTEDEEEEEEMQHPAAQVQPVQGNMQDCHPPSRPSYPIGSHFPVRAPFPIPRNQPQEKDEEIDDEDTYLVPVPVPVEPSTPNHSSVSGKGSHGFHHPSSQLPYPYRIPNITPKDTSMLRKQGSGRIPPGERGPAPLPDTFSSPQKKMSPDSQPLPSRTKVTPRPFFPGSNNMPSAVSENRSGGKSGSFLHQSHQDKPSILPISSRTKESAWRSPLSQEKNDHVYETVDGGPENHNSTVSDWQSPVKPPVPPSRNQNQDFDVQDLSSQFRAVNIPLKKQPSDSRKHSGGNDSGSASGSPKQNLRNRPSMGIGSYPLPVNGSPFNSTTSPQENLPTEITPLPFQGNQPYINLDDGNILMLTPLYQKIMDKPYFHLISRTKAKILVMSGANGTFLIRPSTKSGDPLTLTLKLEDRPYNISIRQRPDSLFALGSEKTQEKTFSSLDGLITTYSKEPIKLENGKVAFLKHTPANIDK